MRAISVLLLTGRKMALGVRHVGSLRMLDMFMYGASRAERPRDGNFKILRVRHSTGLGGKWNVLLQPHPFLSRFGILLVPVPRVCCYAQFWSI